MGWKGGGGTGPQRLVGGLQQRAVTGSTQNVVGSQRATACQMVRQPLGRRCWKWAGGGARFLRQIVGDLSVVSLLVGKTGPLPSDDLQRA